jgi:hypothetical protein
MRRFPWGKDSITGRRTDNRQERQDEKREGRRERGEGRGDEDRRDVETQRTTQRQHEGTALPQRTQRTQRAQRTGRKRREE